MRPERRNRSCIYLLTLGFLILSSKTVQPTVRENIGQTRLSTDPIQSSKPSAAMEALQNLAASYSICTEHAQEKPQQFSATSNSAKFGWILLVKGNKRDLSDFSSLFLSYLVKLLIPALK